MEVEVEAVVDERLVDGQHDVAGAAELDQQVAVFEHAGGERGADVVGGAGHDRHALLEAGLPRPPRR